MRARIHITLDLLATGLSTKLLGQMMVALPDNTQLVDVFRSLDDCIYLYVWHPLFKEGAEITPVFTRNVAIVKGKPEYFDTFSGFYDSSFLRDGSQDEVPTPTGE